MRFGAVRILFINNHTVSYGFFVYQKDSRYSRLSFDPFSEVCGGGLDAAGGGRAVRTARYTYYEYGFRSFWLESAFHA